MGGRFAFNRGIGGENDFACLATVQPFLQLI
jgi:hypothetical protein